MLNQRGFSLMEAVVVSGIMVIMLAGTSRMFIGLSQQASYTEDRVSALQMQNLIQGALLSDETLCSCNLRPDAHGAGTSKKINALSSEGEKLTFSKIQNGCDPDSVSIVEVGGEINHRMQVDSIELVDFEGDLSSGASWHAKLRLTINSAAKQKLRPMEIPVLVNLDTSAGASNATIDGCSSQSANGGGGGILSGTLGSRFQVENLTTAQQMTSDCFVQFHGGGKDCDGTKGFLSIGKDEASAADKSGYKGACANPDCMNTRVTGFQSTEVFVPKGHWIRSNTSKCYSAHARCVE